MKVSVNWIKQYTTAPLEDTAVLVTKIGSQLGEVEAVNELGPQYAGAVLVRVVTCNPHEDSDHLKICKIDDGGVVAHVPRDKHGLVQVVCGAPNVHAGALVVWLPPGVTVPESYAAAEPFVLGARELRGVLSQGMLASPRELALGDSHDGLLLIHQEFGRVRFFAEAFGLDDTIIDIENKMFTHRPDCFGQLGVAREIAGIFDVPFSSPDWYSQPPVLPQGEGLPLTVTNQIPVAVPRFTAITLKDASVTASPVWLQTALARVGIRPVNNIVDVTNYLMALTGQPLHAYDYDKVAANTKDGKTKTAELTIRYPQPAEKLALLNGKTITPRAEAIVISSSGQAIGLGGVMGGASTEIDERTTNIILEVASFDMYSIRRTSMAHGLFSEAVTRFTKGQSPFQNDRVLAEAVRLLGEHAAAVPAGPVVDVHDALEEAIAQNIRVDFINSRLGLQLTAQEMMRLLRNVEFEVYDMGNLDEIFVKPPFWRTDIAIPEDIVEEVGRLYGFDKLPLELPLRPIEPAARNPLLDVKSAARRSLAKTGADEVLTYSFVHGKMLEKAGQNPAEAFALSNALSPDLQYYRLSLTPSLLDKVHANDKAGYDRFALFEIGKGHSLARQTTGPDGLPEGLELLAYVYSVRDKVAPSEAAYYYARHTLQQLMHDLRIAVDFRVITDLPDTPLGQPYEPGRSAYVFLADSDVFLGIVGEFTAAVRRNLKLPEHSAGFEINLSVVLEAQQQAVRQPYTVLSRFPTLSQDLCLKLPAATAYQTVADFVLAEAQRLRPDDALVSIEPVDIYQRPEDPTYKQITLRLTLVHYAKTMVEAEVTNLLSAIAAAAAETLQAERV